MKTNYMGNGLVKLYVLDGYILSKFTIILLLAIDGISKLSILANFEVSFDFIEALRQETMTFQNNIYMDT